MAINFPKEQGATLKDSMEQGGGIKLPFDVTYWFVVNGDKRMRSVGGVHYFGGWATDQNKLAEVGATWDPPITNPPSYADQGEITTNNGKVIPSYLSRAMFVAPIGFRTCWEKTDFGTNQTTRFKDYQPGTRRKAQFLVYVADKTEQKQLVPWGPAVLTVGGMQVGKVLDAFKAWSKHIDKARRILEADAPAWVFYSAIGTFGDEYKSEMVGQSGAQSSITPMVCHLPEEMTAEKLEKYYVGADVVNHMAELKAEAAEWLNAWSNMGAQPAAAGNGNAHGNGFEPPMPPDNFDDIPF